MKIAIRSWRSRLSKSADIGGAFTPSLAGKLFSVTEIVSGNGKHSLLFALCKYVPSAHRTDYRTGRRKNRQGGFHLRRNRYSDKDTDRFCDSVLWGQCLLLPFQSHKQQWVETG